MVSFWPTPGFPRPNLFLLLGDLPGPRNNKLSFWSHELEWKGKNKMEGKTQNRWDQRWTTKSLKSVVFCLWCPSPFWFSLWFPPFGFPLTPTKTRCAQKGRRWCPFGFPFQTHRTPLPPMALGCPASNPQATHSSRPSRERSSGVRSSRAYEIWSKPRTM